MTAEANRLRRLPGALLLAMVVAGVGSREWYPFSPFPMYAAFTPTSWHIFLTDGDDHVISPQQLFGVSAIPLRRQFERRVIIEQSAAGQPPETADERAALVMLRFLVAEARPQAGAPAPPARLRLWRVNSQVDGTRVVSTKQLLGEIALP
jgi:hypothetical protein